MLVWVNLDLDHSRPRMLPNRCTALEFSRLSVSTPEGACSHRRFRKAKKCTLPLQTKDRRNEDLTFERRLNRMEHRQQVWCQKQRWQRGMETRLMCQWLTCRFHRFESIWNWCRCKSSEACLTARTLWRHYRSRGCTNGSRHQFYSSGSGSGFVTKPGPRQMHYKKKNKEPTTIANERHHRRSAYVYNRA